MGFGRKAFEQERAERAEQQKKNFSFLASATSAASCSICSGFVFIGHNVTFINDAYPRAANPDGSLQTETDWKVVETHIHRGASVGSSATILCGISIGEGAIVGAGSVVTKDVPAFTIVAGNPARVIRKLENK